MSRFALGWLFSFSLIATTLAACSGGGSDAGISDGRPGDRDGLGLDTCGVPGFPCCPGNACGGGGCCVQGMCAAMGGACGALGGTCNNGACGTCGGVGMSCCTVGGTGTCTASGTRCWAGICAACGNAGTPCCEGQGTRVCLGAGLTCSGNACVVGQSGPAGTDGGVGAGGADGAAIGAGDAGDSAVDRNGADGAASDVGSAGRTSDAAIGAGGVGGLAAGGNTGAGGTRGTSNAGGSTTSDLGPIVTGDASMDAPGDAVVGPAADASSKAETRADRYDDARSPDSAADAPNATDAACPAGSYRSAASQCIAKTTCASGSFVDNDGTETSDRVCKFCLEGTYSALSNAIECLACPAGTYSSAGASGCKTCPLGSSAPQGSASCTPCQAGFYATSAACLPCAPGSYASSPSSQSCAACAAGTYAAQEGSTTCTPCPADATSGDSASYCVPKARHCITPMIAHLSGGYCSGSAYNLTDGSYNTSVKCTGSNHNTVNAEAGLDSHVTVGAVSVAYSLTQVDGDIQVVLWHSDDSYTEVIDEEKTGAGTLRVTGSWSDVESVQVIATARSGSTEIKDIKVFSEANYEFPVCTR